VGGWWEGVFAKESGAACKNDTNIELSFHGVEIKFSLRVFVKMF
jgi:hypothetical protein